MPDGAGQGGFAHEGTHARLLSTCPKKHMNAGQYEAKQSWDHPVLRSLFHLYRPDQREKKKKHARIGGANFMGIINEVS